MRRSHSSHRLFWVSFSIARVAATTQRLRLPVAPCSSVCGGFEWKAVVVDISFPLLEHLDKHVLQVRFDRLDPDERQMLRTHLGEQVIESLLVRDRPADKAVAVVGPDLKAVEPRHCGA